VAHEAGALFTGTARGIGLAHRVHLYAPNPRGRSLRGRGWVAVMSRTRIEGGNWHMRLAEATGSAAPGDVIEVPNWFAAQLGHTAAARLRGEDHEIVFEVGGRVVPYLDADEPPDGFDADGLPA